MGGFLAFAALRADAVGLASRSIPLFVYGSIVVVGRIAFAKAPDRLPSLPLGAAALAVIAAGLTVTAAWDTGAGLITGTALLAVGVTFSTPAFFAAVFATAGPTERGAASGTVSACLDLGLGGGPHPARPARRQRRSPVELRHRRRSRPRRRRLDPVPGPAGRVRR